MDYNKDLTMESDFIGQFNPVKRRPKSNNSNNENQIVVQQDNTEPFLISYGGLVDYPTVPSHSAVAMIAAAKSGYKWVSIDTYLTKDNVVVNVPEEFNTFYNNTSGEPVSEEFNIQTINSADLLQHYTSDEKGLHHILTFDQAINIAKQQGLNVLINMYASSYDYFCYICGVIKQYGMLENCIVSLMSDMIIDKYEILQSYNQLAICIVGTIDISTIKSIMQNVSNKLYLSVDLFQVSTQPVMIKNALMLGLPTIAFLPELDSYSIQKVSNVIDGLFSFVNKPYQELKKIVAPNLEYSDIILDNWDESNMTVSAFYEDSCSVNMLSNNFVNAYIQDESIAELNVLRTFKNEDSGIFITETEITARTEGCTTLIAFNGTITKRTPVYTEPYAVVIGDVGANGYYTYFPMFITLLSTNFDPVSDTHANIREDFAFSYDPVKGYWGNKFSIPMIPTGSESFTINVSESDNITIKVNLYDVNCNLIRSIDNTKKETITITENNEQYISFSARFDDRTPITQKNYETIYNAFMRSISGSTLGDLLGKEL